MPLASSGTISLSQVQTEFGGTNPISMSEYYTNAVSGFTSGITGLPASGTTVSLSVFRGKAKPSSGIPYAFSSHTFTNAGATGQTGPIISQVRSAYSTAAWAQNNSYLSMTTQGIQLWTVPATGSYTITCAGSKGGNNTSSGGSGAIMTGTFSFTSGDIVSILVGQVGNNGISEGGNCSGGGGGGTFVIYNGSPLIVAGGGGGGGGTNPYGGGGAGGAGGAGNSGLNGVNGSGSGGTGGTGGTGATGGSDGSGGGNNGGGYSGNGSGGGGYTLGGGINLNGKAYLNGGTGGYSTDRGNAWGGFGGGACSYVNGAGYASGGGGGGGGYSGGGGGGWGAWGGGGGGSYGGTFSSYNTGVGYVTITKV